MANSILSAPHFQDESAAFDYVEAHLWPKGPVCPHCGEREKIGRLSGKTTRAGLRKCYACRKPFTVRIGSIFEDSHLPLHLWLQVIHLMCSSKKGISTRQIQRTIKCGLKTAWHLTHRIRLAMVDGAEGGPLGGAGKHVEADETYFGNKPHRKVKQGVSHKRAILSLVERGGEVRSFHLDNNVTVRDIGPILAKNLDTASTLNTDESKLYRRIGKAFEAHQVVNHRKGEYARGSAYTNTLEGFFSVFKRGMVGVYQHCDERHLHRYLSEFDFRYNSRAKLGVNDEQRTSRAVMGAKGKRLTYQTIGRA
jgi:transposase-like protein